MSPETNGSRTNGYQIHGSQDKWVSGQMVPEKWVSDKCVPGQMGPQKMPDWKTIKIPFSLFFQSKVTFQINEQTVSEC